MSKIKLVGLDPSLRNFGVVKATYSIDHGTFVIDDMYLSKSEGDAGKSVRKNSDDLRRARFSFEAMRDACQDAQIVIAEVPVGSQSARAMASYGICIGVLAACPRTLIEVTPSEVKRVMTGYTTATKEEMIEAAMRKYPEAKWLTRKLHGKTVPRADNEHLADAIGALEAGVQTQQFKGIIAAFKSINVSQ